MSFFNDKTKLTVKTSNISTVAKFSSTLDEAYFLILALNSNNYLYGCNNTAAVFGANSASNFETYIGIANDNVINKLAKFNQYEIALNRNLVVSGNMVPSSNIVYDLGTPENRWRDLYLSGTTLYLGNTVLSSDPVSGSLNIKTSSNTLAPIVSSKIKLLSDGISSNYSVFTSGDTGINLTYYDKDNNIINHLDLGDGTTSMLPEGSNLYYTYQRFDDRLLTKTLDNIHDGTSNRYIINDVYSRDLHVTGTLFTSNLVVYGDRTTLNTETYQTEQLEIASDANGPVLTVQQLGSNDIMHVYTGSNIAFLINTIGSVGINTSDPQYHLDVRGIANATYFRGDGSQLWNINLEDRTTSLLAEGSNLYYTSERVGIIATSSNIDSSNYILNISNEISNRLSDTSNNISNRITDTSNIISNRITDTSNIISDDLTDTSNVMSMFITDTSNMISINITNTSNVISTRITHLTTTEIAEGSNMFYTVERFDARLLTKTLDDIYNGTSNRYIVNNVYDSDLRVTGTVTASNLVVHGSFATLDTMTYQTKKLEIISDTDSPALLIRQDGMSNIMEVYDDSNIVLSVLNGGFVGINKIDPVYTLDVDGTTHASYFIGDGAGLYNVNLSDRSTTLLTEGSNLYYTSERVGIISTSSNIETSNYILFSSNALANHLTNNSNNVSMHLTNTSNNISTRITALTTDEIAEGSNLYYTIARFDDRLRTKTADNVRDGTSNRYIINDIYDSDLRVTGTLITSNLIVSGDISILNTNTYQTERMEIISDVNGPALRITQLSSNDLLHVYDDDFLALAVVKGGNVGVHTGVPLYNLDVAGIVRATYFIGNGASLSNVYFEDRSTSLLKEGSNLYYTAHRVGEIADTSNFNTSNYILDTSNYLIATILHTSNTLTDTINNVVTVQIENTLAYLIYTSNLLINNITNTSNELTYDINQTIDTEINTTINNLNYTSNLLNNLIKDTSNELTSIMNNVVNVQVSDSANQLANVSNQLAIDIVQTSNSLMNNMNNVVQVQITNTSNFIVQTSNLLTAKLDTYYAAINTRIDNLDTTKIPEGTNLYYTDARFNTMLLSKTLDDIRDGTSNKYIINDTYTGDLYVTGTLSTSNLIVNGNTTTLNTTTYQSKKLEIISDAIGPALKIQQNGIYDIMQVFDDSNLVLSIVNGGRVGINNSNPLYTLDITGTTRTSFLIGDGAGLTNVNLQDRTTSMLTEGSNLYYTPFRVGIIASSCNINTSNYILNSSNAISTRITLTSNELDAYITSTSNNLYTNLILSSNFITNNLAVTSNYLMISLINTSNLAVSTSNEIMFNLIAIYNTVTSNFLANSNLLASNIQVTSNNLANMVTNTFLNITTNVTDTSNTLVNAIISTSNNLINNTISTFIILSSNLNATSNAFASNIPIVYNNLLNNLLNVSNQIATQLNFNSNMLTNTIITNSNLFTSTILETSNLISTRITNTSNIISVNILNTSNNFSSDLTFTSNFLTSLFQQNSNEIYRYFNQTSNSLSTDIVRNSNLISTRITNLNLDMIAAGTSNTFIVNNIYDANLTITGSLTVNSLDVVDLGLLEVNESGDYINTDMKTFVSRITSNVLLNAPVLILNASNNFSVYDTRQSNYIATKQDILTGSASSITNTNLTANRVVVTNSYGKLAASSVHTSNLDLLADLNTPIQTQINNLNVSSSNLALTILDQISFLNDSIGLTVSSTGNNLTVTNVVTTCNLINFDPILLMKFEDTRDSSKYASKNYVLSPQNASFVNHTDNLIVWYKFNNNTKNYVDNSDLNLYLVYGAELYVLDRNYGLNSLLFNGTTAYTMGAYNSIVNPRGFQANSDGMSISFWMNPSRLFTGRQYIFSFATSNFVNPLNILQTTQGSVEAYINISNLSLSVSHGSNMSVYNVPYTLYTNTDYNVTWIMTRGDSWKVYMNGVNTSNISGLLYPVLNNSNYTYNAVGGQMGTYTSNMFFGYLSDLRVYNKSLSIFEISDNNTVKYPEYDYHRNDLLLWYNFDGHLQNFDGDPKYALTLAGGTMNFMSVKSMSLYSLYFNGSTYYSMNTASAINLNTVSTIFPYGLTFSVTFNPMNLTSTQYLFAISDTASSTPSRSVEIFLTNAQLNFRVRQNSTTTMQTVTLNTSIIAQRFYNVTWEIVPRTTNTNANWYIYLNGVNIYTAENDRFYPVSGSYINNYIGSLFNTGYFTGYIDDFRLYKKALSNDEIIRINYVYRAYGSFTNHTNNMISWYKFDNDNKNDVANANVPLVFLNFKDKDLMLYNDTNNYILYNSSNITNIYPTIDNFTSQSMGYDATNSYALSATWNRYVYYTNADDIMNLVNLLHKQGFLLHFSFNSDRVDNIHIFNIRNSGKTFISVSIYYGQILLVMIDGSNRIVITTVSTFSAGVWNNVNIIGRVSNTYLIFEIYVNSVRQIITGGYSGSIVYTSSNISLEYRGNLQYNGSNTIMYIANNPMILISSNYTNGAMLTTTYYSSNANYDIYVSTFMSGLVGWYKFENNLNDSSGNNYHLSYYSSYWATTSSAISFNTTFKAEGSYSANFTSGRYLTNDNLNISAKSYTIAFWIRPTSDGLVIQQGSNTFTNGYIQFRVISNYMRIDVYSGTRLEIYDANLYNNWSYWTFTFNRENSRTYKIYKNGVLLGTTVNGSDPTFTANTLRIGKTEFGGFDTFVGYLDDLRFYYRVLSDSDVTALYNLDSTKITQLSVLPLLLTNNSTSISSFNQNLTDANNNKSYVYRNSLLLASSNILNNNYYLQNSNYFTLNSINSNQINYMLIDLIGNFYVDSEAAYHFALDLQNDTVADLILSKFNIFNVKNDIVVASYYNGSLGTVNNTINNSSILQYPIRLVKGFYELNLRVFRNNMTSNYFIAKYYKYPSYDGTTYNLISTNLNYVDYSTLDANIQNNMTHATSNLFVNNYPIVTTPASTIVKGSLLSSNNTPAVEFNESASSNFFIYDTNYVANLRDVRLYTPEVMGTSNNIAGILDNGIYNVPNGYVANNLMTLSNISYDSTNYYKGISSIKFSSNSVATLPANFYNFGGSDTTISMWIEGDNSPLKYPLVPFTSAFNGLYCISSSFSNIDTWRCFDALSANTSLNITTFTQVYGIGYNNVGQLGDNSTANRTTGYVPTIVPTTINDIFVQIEGSANVTGWHVHLLTDSGRVYALQSAGLSLISPFFFNNEKIVFIASGRSTYFITESGLLYAYGNNTYWQLGNGNNTDQSVPVLIPASRWNGEKVAYVATGSYHTYIITVSGAIYTIGYNNGGQLGTGNTINQTTWTLFTALSDVLRIYCAGDQTYCITNTGLLYSIGVRASTPAVFLESSIPQSKKIIKVSFSPSNCAFALADDGTVYGFGNNPISMPNTSSAQTIFIQITSAVWGNLKIVDVVTAGDHTFYTLENGLVYVVGNNNYGQLNISTSTGSSKTPLLVNIGGAKINLVYGGLFTTGYNIITTYPSVMYIEFGANRGEYIKFDALNACTVNYAQVVLNTPFSTTSLSYAISMKLYGTNADSALINTNVLWDFMGSYDGTLSYSASAQTVNIVVSSANKSYRYYAVLINSRYNINITDIGVYVNNPISQKKTIFDACIDEYNYVNISLESSNIIASVCSSSNTTSIFVSNPNIYTTGVLYGFSYSFNTDLSDATWKIYLNGVCVRTLYPMNYPMTGLYSTIMLGRSVYPVNNNVVYNNFVGYLDDFRIYNRALTTDEMSSLYTNVKFNVEGYTSGDYVNKYALVSSRDMYVYNTNYNDVYNLLRNIDANGFTIHFVFKSSNVNDAQLYYIGGSRTNKISIRVIGGILYITLGNVFVIYTKNGIFRNTWYIVDLVASVTNNNRVTLQLYLNNILQPIYINGTLNTAYVGNYSNMLSPDNVPNTGVYIGAINTIYKDANEIMNGATITNTYFSSNLIIKNTTSFPSLMSRCSVNAADFSNLLVGADLYYSHEFSCNIGIFDVFNSDFYFSNINFNSNQTSFILNEIDANIKLGAGYYYFANGITSNDVTAELYLGVNGFNDMKIVAAYYSSNFVVDGLVIDELNADNRTTALPIYIPDGYYKFYSRTYSRSDRKYFHHKCAILNNYTGNYYTMLNTFDYHAYSNLDSGVRDASVLLNSNLYVNKNTSNSVLIKGGGYLDSSLYTVGRVTQIFDAGLVNKGTIDTATTTYVNRLNLGNSLGARLINWGFFTNVTGRNITPLVLEYINTSNYTVRGIGTSRNITTSGINTFPFQLVSGTDVFSTSNHLFGWKDGTTTTANAGVITYDTSNLFNIPLLSTVSALYAFTTHTFTNASVTGRFGPTLFHCRNAYSTVIWTQDTANNYLNMTTQGIQLWTVPATGSYTITCAGAKGGSTDRFTGGQGITMSGTFTLTKGEIIKIAVGQIGGSYAFTGGGGGGSFVSKSDNTPLIVAGGGGGAGDSGGNGYNASTLTSGTIGHSGYAAGVDGYGSTSTDNGGWGQSGAGFYGDGNGRNTSASWGSGEVAKAFVNGATGAQENGTSATSSCNGAPGGFGGGGSGACNGGGGGGGYSGGGAGGGGGGSFNSGASQSNGTLNNGVGYVTIAPMFTVLQSGYISGYTLTSAASTNIALDTTYAFGDALYNRVYSLRLEFASSNSYLIPDNVYATSNYGENLTSNYLVPYIPDFSYPDGIYSPKLIESMLQINPKKRPSIKDLLNNSWIN
jgi:alpha-tubulin suppressor-like RCC1 family protein